MAAAKAQQSKNIGPEILTAIQQVRQSVKAIVCTMKNYAGGGGRKIMSYNDVIKATMKAEGEVGLVWVGPVDWQVQTSGSEGETRATAEVVDREGQVKEVRISESLSRFTYRLYHIATGQYIEVISWGRGIDQNDKDLGKAATYAAKYVRANLYGLLRADEQGQQDDEDPDTSLTRKPAYRQPAAPMPAGPSAKPPAGPAPIQPPAPAPAPEAKKEGPPAAPAHEKPAVVENVLNQVQAAEADKQQSTERARIDEHFDKVLVPNHALDPTKYHRGESMPSWESAETLIDMVVSAGGFSDRGKAYLRQRVMYNWYLIQCNVYPDQLTTIKKSVQASDMVEVNKTRLVATIDKAMAAAKK